MKSTSRPAIVTALVFVLSGSAALIFETAWFRIVGLTLGSSVWSAAAVLMAFMTGLGIGNMLVAAYGHKIRLPFVWYAIAEVLIGIFGLLSVLILPGLSPLIAGWLATMISDPTTLNVARFCIAFLIFLVPAIAMGATLPILQKGLFQYNKSFSKSLAHLYGWNTIGAVTGALLSEFLLIEHLGITGAAGVACALNLAAALILLKVFDDAKPTANDSKPQALFATVYQLRFALFPPFLTGLTLLALEVVWFRYLLLTQNSTSAIFAIMLAVVLAGIGIGGLIVSRLRLTEVDLDKLLFRLSLLAAVVTVLSFYLFALMYENFFDRLYNNSALLILEGIVLMLPGCILSGLLFPLFGEKLYRQVGGTTSPSGSLTFANTLGSAIGTGLATFLLLPLLGVEYSILALSLVYVLVAAVVMMNSQNLRRVRTSFAAPAGALVLVLVVFPYGTMAKSYEIFSNTIYPGEKLIAVKEGVNETLQYYREDKFDRPLRYRLVTNGHSMTGTGFASQRYMRMFVYMPYLLHDNIDSVLQISYGVGVTAEAVVSLPDMTHFDVVDISEDVLTMSEIIHDTSGVHPQKDPRTRVHVEDGRFFLQTTDNTYDLITAEPPPPKNAGVVNLYSQEYFELIYSRLNEGGIVSYWLPDHTLQDEDTLAIIKAFCNAFPDCSMWNSVGLEFMLIGSKGGIDPLEIANMESRWTGSIVTEMQLIGLEQPEQLGAMFMADHLLLNQLTANTPPVVDNFPMRISNNVDGVDRRTELTSYLVDPNRRRDAFVSSEYIQSIFPQTVIDEALGYFRPDSIYINLTLPLSWEYRASLLEPLVYVLSETDLVVLPALMLGSDPTQLSMLEDLNEINSVEQYESSIINALATRDYERASSMLGYFVGNIQGDPRLLERYASLYYLSKALDGTLSEADLALVESNPNFRVSNQFVEWMRRDYLYSNTPQAALQ